MISEEQFFAYEGVRRYGAWNMFDKDAMLASGLDDDTYQEIMYNYDSLHKKFVPKEQSAEWIKKEEKRIDEIVDKINERYNE